MGTVISKNIILVGPSGGGKTTLLQSLKHQRCTSRFDPSAVYNVERIKYSLNSSRFLFHVFDLAGAQHYPCPSTCVHGCAKGLALAVLLRLYNDKSARSVRTPRRRRQPAVAVATLLHASACGLRLLRGRFVRRGSHEAGIQIVAHPGACAVTPTCLRAALCQSSAWLPAVAVGLIDCSRVVPALVLTAVAQVNESDLANATFIVVINQKSSNDSLSAAHIRKMLQLECVRCSPAWLAARTHVLASERVATSCRRM